MLSLRTLIPAVLIALPAFTSAQQQAPYVVECDATDLTTPPSTPLDDWINSLLNVLHDNAKFAFEDVVVGFAQTEQGYDVLEQIWEATANGGAGEKYSLMVPSEEVSRKEFLYRGRPEQIDQQSTLTSTSCRPLPPLVSPNPTSASKPPPSTLCSRTTLSPSPSVQLSTNRPPTPSSRPCFPSPTEMELLLSSRATERMH